MRSPFTTRRSPRRAQYIASALAFTFYASLYMQAYNAVRLCCWEGTAFTPQDMAGNLHILV